MTRAARKKVEAVAEQLPLVMEAPTRSTAVLVEAVAVPSPRPDVQPPVTRALMLADIDPCYAPQPPAFGAWLIKQKERGGFVGDLAKAAAGDRGFPRNGNVAAVLKHLATVGANGDMFEALEDAERAWLAAA